MNQPPKDQKPQFIRIDRGISQFNHDYYAALGLPINADPIYIRHVYLSIARILHPDVYGFSPKEKAIATEFLSKLVNPAYNVLMMEQERLAYQAIFKLLAKRLMQKSRNIKIYSAVACELITTPNDGFYERAISAIAKRQYASLQNILECTAQISELNLVYILYKEGYEHGAANMPPVLSLMVQPKSTNTSTMGYLGTPPKNSYPSTKPTSYYSTQPAINRQTDADATVFQTIIEESDRSAINDRLKICEIYMSQQDWMTALKELRDILQLDKDNSKCLAMLGVVYKNLNQPQMAKVSLQRSLQINPQEPLALQLIKDLRDSSSSTKTANTNTKNNPKPNPAPKKTPLPPPQNRGWMSNLLGWISPDNNK